MEYFQNNISQNPENKAAQLALIAGMISTLGDALGTIATVLAIQEAEEKTPINPDIINLQKQLDEIYMEIKEIKKMLRNKEF